MDSVTAVRSQVPLPAQGTTHSPDRLTSAPAAQTEKPIAEPIRSDAIHQPASLPAQAAVELADQDQHPATAARAAADAAREAYINASIAAGISPLPLP